MVRLFSFLGDSPISTRAAGCLAPNAQLPCHKCWIKKDETLDPDPDMTRRTAEQKEKMYRFIAQGATETEKKRRMTSYGLKGEPSPLCEIAKVEEVVEIDPFHALNLNICKRHLSFVYSFLKKEDRELASGSISAIKLPRGFDRIPTPPTEKKPTFAGFRGVDMLHL